MTKLDVWVAYANIARFRGLIAVADSAGRVAEIQLLLEEEQRKLAVIEAVEPGIDAPQSAPFEPLGEAPSPSLQSNATPRGNAR